MIQVQRIGQRLEDLEDALVAALMLLDRVLEGDLTKESVRVFADELWQVVSGEVQREPDDAQEED